MSLVHSDAQQPLKRSDTDTDCIDSLPLLLRLEAKRTLETQDTSTVLLRTKSNHARETCEVDNSTNLGSAQPSFIDPCHFTQETQSDRGGNRPDFNSSSMTQSSHVLGSPEAPIVID